MGTAHTVQFPWKLNTMNEESFDGDGVRNGIKRQLHEWFDGSRYITFLRSIFIIVAQSTQNSNQARQGRLV